MRLELTDRRGRTLVEHLVTEIAGRIAARELLPGRKLPSIRQFAETHAISKFTVVEVYDRLVAQGLLTSKQKAGFYVAGHRQPLRIAETERPVEREIDPLWIMRQSLLPDRDMLKPGCGWLPEDWYNEHGLRRTLRMLARAPQAQLAGYDEPLGYLPLRTQLQITFAQRGIEVGANQILLTDSGSQAIDLASRLLVQPGDSVFVDDPGYFNFQTNLRVHRAKVIGIPYQQNGPDIAAFAAQAALHRPRLYITNAALHNPTGGSLSPALAHQILKVAEQFDFAILEDDIFADFENRPSPRLAALDQLNRVIYIGSFSKTVSAALRCGYIVARPDWIEGLIDLKLATTYGNSASSAHVVYRLLAEGGYRKHVEAVRDRLRVAAMDVNRQLKACGLTLWTQPDGGMFLWAMLPEGVDSADIARRALEKKIILAPGNVFSVSQSASRFLRFNVAQSRSKLIFNFLLEALD